MRLGTGREKSYVEEQDFTPVRTEKITAKGQLAKIRRMGFKEGSRYFWYYYRVRVIAAVLLLVSAVSIGRSYIKNSRPYLLHAVCYNCYTEGDTEAFCETYAAQRGVSLKKYQMRLDRNLKLNAEDISSEEQYAVGMRLQSQISAKELDIVVGNDYIMRAFTNMRSDRVYLADLRELLPEPLKERLGDRMTVYTDLEGRELAAGIELSGSLLTEELGFDQSPLYLGIFANTPRPEEAVRFLDYIFGEGEAL